jgi:hypothetical protein
MKIVILILFSSLLVGLSNAQIGVRAGWVSSEGTTAENAYPVLVEAFASLDRVLPTLTPKETEWVLSEQTEISEKNYPMNRYNKFTNSVEYNLFQIRKEVNSMQSHLDDIKNARIKGNHEEETFAWVQICMALEQNNMERYLSTYVAKSTVPVVFEEKSHVFVWKDKTVHVAWQLWAGAIWGGFLKEDLRLALKLEDK